MQEEYEIGTSIDIDVTCDECLSETTLIDVWVEGSNKGYFSFDWGCPHCEIAHTGEVYLGSF